MSALRWVDVSLQKNGRALLDHVSLSVEKGELLGVVGPNGAGKSTLLRAAAGLEPAIIGGIEIAGVALAQIPPRMRARQLAYLPQLAETAWPISVEDAVSLGRLPYLSPALRPNDADRRAVNAAINTLGIGDLRHRSLTSLSAGEIALVLLARALAVEADCLIVDEPTAALDPYHQLAVMDLFRRLTSEGRTVCVALHDLPLAARFCHRLAVMMEGRIESVGPPNTALDDSTLQRIYGVTGTRHIIAGEHLLVPWERLPPEDRR